MKIEHVCLQELDDAAAWDALVARSPQGSVFATSGFLQALGLPHRRLAVCAGPGAGSRVLALLPVVEDAARRAVLRPPYTPHLGPLFVPDPQATWARQRIDDEYTLTQWMVERLTERYERVALSLSPAVADVRAFQWHNYHEPAAGQFRLTPRYTAVLPLGDKSAEDLRAAARACRRQEEKKARDCRIVEQPSLQRFLALYESTFARQDLAVEGENLQIVARLATDSVAQGWGRLAGCETPDGQLAAATLFVYDARRAYYLFAANDPALRHTGAATRLMFDNLEHARLRGLAEVDFVGVNSPNRGDFKLSFNPDLRPYFDVDWAAPAPASTVA
jgi:CelD/BcsL family acetyltransferase involved in cellulose biosynthesis